MQGDFCCEIVYVCPNGLDYLINVWKNLKLLPSFTLFDSTHEQTGSLLTSGVTQCEPGTGVVLIFSLL